MAIQNTSNLSDSIRAQYLSNYVEGALGYRLYDQIAAPVGANMSELKRGSSIRVPFISKLDPSTQTLSESADVIPATLVDTYADITPTTRANAIQWSQLLETQVYTNYTAKAYQALGENMAESIDLLAQAEALGGDLVIRAAARASLDAGTASNRLSKSVFVKAASWLKALKVPSFLTPRGGKWVAIFHPWALVDLLADTELVAVGEYQMSGLILNGELGELLDFKIVCDPRAKVFWGAGADNATSVATTLAAAASRLDKTITVASGSNIAAGQCFKIGTEETADTHYATNEMVYVASIDSTTVTIIGEGENGGLRYSHDSGAAVRNADSAVPIVFGGSESLAKVYDTELGGEYGEVVGPKKDGILDQWTTLGWKWRGGYDLISENRVIRAEVASSMEA